MKKIALIGNPNTGKTSLFNRLTGLNQHVGNFAGVTVDKKSGELKQDGDKIEVIDFPGTYSIYPHSEDEKIVYDVFSNPKNEDFPDIVVTIVDASNLERNLLLFTQIYDLKIPLILVVNMTDIAKRKGFEIKVEKLKEQFSNIQICEINARIGLGVDELKTCIQTELSNSNKTIVRDFVIKDFSLSKLNDSNTQQEETEIRFEFIKKLIQNVVLKATDKTSNIKKKASITKSLSFYDKISVHPIFGYLIFAFILISIFQLIFSIAALPMELIDGLFGNLSAWTSEFLPKGIFSDLVSGGIIPGLGGVLVFLPQILILFFCMGILEETGYLARAVFIMDKLMRPFGLNGKSVVPLISSSACAIPGIMATRTISNRKERLITILIAPLMSCSARIPVFTLLIALVIPNKYVFGFINLQGLTLFAMYALGIIVALAIAFLLKSVIKTEEKSFFLLEIPDFKTPRWKNIFISLYEKGKIFLFEAGKVILAISIILWALASFSPGDRMKKAAQNIEFTSENIKDSAEIIASVKLENSFIGILGKSIEPVIEPLGFDWKIGISLITSFAAREVFVGSMATIYSVHQDNESGLIDRMKNEKNSLGKPVYSLATGLSLMVFYVFAMQCMATLAVVKRETKSWKWPLIQVFYMGALAYIASFIVYNIF